MSALRPAVLFYCEIYRGFGHWMRSLSIVRALARRFRVVVIVTGDRTDLEVPPDVELITFPANAHFPCGSGDGPNRPPLGSRLIAILERVQPAAVILEYFPFGRQQSAVFLIPFVRAARSVPSRPVVLASVRDIQEQALEDQFRYDKRVVLTANRFFDAAMVHSDAGLFSLADSFALAHELTIPVRHTGYVVPERRPVPPTTSQEPLIVVSAGGGRGGESLLRAAVEAQAQAVRGAEPWNYRMRVIAGKFLAESDWDELNSAANGVPGLELIRWVPDLRMELACAALSVSRCGYNTALDILTVGPRALVVPFVEFEEDEQTFRAAKLERLGAVRVLPENQLTPQSLLREMRAAMQWQPSHLEIDCEGAENTARLVEELIAERAPAARLRNASACLRALTEPRP
jgi:predicted glycosyltransferase